MKQQVHPAVVAGAIFVAALVIGFFAYHAAVPATTPHPDPARFMAHTSVPNAH